MTAVVEVENLTKHYGAVAAVDGISFSVQRGEIFGILGPNGAGKTTTVEAIEGLRRPDAGRISVLGLDPYTDGGQLRQRVGVQLQEGRLPDKIKVWEALDLYASFYANPAPWPDLLAQLGLGDKRDARFGSLSGGQKQRLSIALALIGSPEVAILDELTTGLDPHARRETWDLVEAVRGRGVTILLVTHFMDEAERLADRIAIIDEGKVVAIDTPAGLVARVSSEQRIRFRASGPFDVKRLTELPEVTDVSTAGSQVVVAGTGNLLAAVVGSLDRQGVVPGDLRVEQTSLDDAFVALTGRRLDPDGAPVSSAASS